MPTIVRLVTGDAIPTCPPDGASVALCTEGRDLTPLLRRAASHGQAGAQDGEAGTQGAGADDGPVFMQYAACMHDDFVWHDGAPPTLRPRTTPPSASPPHHRTTRLPTTLHRPLPARSSPRPQAAPTLPSRT